ncbi:uncharacterized protein LOC110184140 [Drosophila serrata]|uniref:uncharacterized protein LOC110184140 n=1 Tax=Drosophila serrata TaxID=7274 RepID=UPI000A1D00DA|nr:uncharacterized protein LOC110184140 [Drosophila serrata]KAH8366965.1 hypothetical protein KR200_011685 [Drosophila serrata]
MAASGLILLSIFLLTLASCSLSAAQQIVESEGRGAESKVRLLDRFDNRYPDGSYEYRFELDDGTSRYERGYFAKINEVKTLMVVGYYSYRMSDGRFLTVFYNADQFGYRQNQSITPQVYPNLPRSIEVPMAGESSPLEASTSSRLESPSAAVTPSQLSTSTPRGTGNVTPNRRGGRY